MQVIQDALRSLDLPYGCVATIGNYDGIHRGQRAVIDRIVERARERGVQAVVITFSPHPVTVLRPGEAPPLLTLDLQREALLEAAGVDVVAIVRFSAEFARTAPRTFVRELLVDKLAVEEIFVGSDFSFGRDRAGDVELLEAMGKELGFVVAGVDEETWRGEVISATRIRRAVAEGRVADAMEMLGRPYSLYGTVVRGDRMGARLGWPTINLAPQNEHLPASGVYCGRVHFRSLPGNFDCVTNIGRRPTVYENYQQVVESHILGFSADVYGETVEVEFYKRLREEKLFPSVMDLSAQIGRDVEATRDYFATRRRLQAVAADAADPSSAGPAHAESDEDDELPLM
ncbi:MAG: bifunctional riboflavin kinase/FAD synthetase [Acidobacteriota bacterium]